MIKLENVSYVYNANTPQEKVAIENINLEIAQGEMVGIIGHTGSGKSTLIQHLNGLLRPTSGRVWINGQDIWSDPKQIRKFRFQVGLVFQYPEYQLFEESVYKDIAFGPKNMGLDEEQIRQRVYEAAQFVGLKEDILEKSPFELSGGQKRRVAIAGVIAMNPDVLVLDEPTAGLDPKGRDRILGQIQKYHEQRKNTVLLVSHSMEDIAKFADKALVMNQGRIEMYEEVAQVFSQAEKIEKIGLGVPQITRIFNALEKKGYPVHGGVYTLPQALAEINAVLERKQK